MSTIVIGAGPAGLVAARALQRAAEDVVVLEAQPHIGGRLRTVRDRLEYGAVADLGASFLDLGQDKLLSLCDELGLSLTPQMALFYPDPDGRLTSASPLRATMVRNGRRVDDADRDAIANEVRAALDAFPPSPTEMIPAWAARAGLSSGARQIYNAQTGYNPVNESDSVQMAMLEPPHVGRSCWLLADGTDSVTQALSHGLDIRLKQPVRLITRTRTQVVVETDTDRFACNEVIVATPVTPTLRIGFDPVLPDWKVDALLATPMTQGGKVIGQYRDGAAIASAFGPSIVSDGPVSLAWHRPVDDHDTIVVLGLMPDRADGAQRDGQRALGHLDDLLRAATGMEVERIAGIHKNWTQELYAGGVVSSLMGDFPRLPSLLAQAVGRLHFAGEHTAEMWQTSMDGAMRSGERAAAEVLQNLSIRKPTGT
jgi:monoamine oxidase